jgi:hypothetical protein
LDHNSKEVGKIPEIQNKTVVEKSPPTIQTIPKVDFFMRLVDNGKWMLAEEICQTRQEVNGFILIEILIKNQKLAEALGVSQRLKIPITLSLFKSEEVGRLNYMAPSLNFLQTLDTFNACENFLSHGREHMYLSLKSLGYSIESNVVVVANMDGRVLAKALHLLQEAVLGINLEYAFKIIENKKNKVASIQVASSTTIFYFDVVDKKPNSFLIYFFKQLFSHSTLKIAVTSELNTLSHLAAFFRGTSVEIFGQNFVDVGTLTDAKQFVKFHHGKLLSTYNQESDWERKILRKSQLHECCLKAVLFLKMATSPTIPHLVHPNIVQELIAPKNQVYLALQQNDIDRGAATGLYLKPSSTDTNLDEKPVVLWSDSTKTTQFFSSKRLASKDELQQLGAKVILVIVGLNANAHKALLKLGFVVHNHNKSLNEEEVATYNERGLLIIHKSKSAVLETSLAPVLNLKKGGAWHVFIAKIVAFFAIGTNSKLFNIAHYPCCRQNLVELDVRERTVQGLKNIMPKIALERYWKCMVCQRFILIQ